MKTDCSIIPATGKYFSRQRAFSIIADQNGAKGRVVAFLSGESMSTAWGTFSSLPAKNHRNAKAQPEKKTFRGEPLQIHILTV